MNKTIKNVCVVEPPPHLSLPCLLEGSGDLVEVNVLLSQAWGGARPGAEPAAAGVRFTAAFQCHAGSLWRGI